MRRSARGISRAYAARFVLISLIFIVVQVSVLALGWAALRMIDTTRAYATGESYYSKAANDAVLYLYKYVDTGTPASWRAFGTSLGVTFGDRTSRQELDRSSPNLTIATAGYLRGRNSIADIPDAILVFRLFRHWGPFAAAIGDWRRGDRTIDQLVAIADDVHARAPGPPLTGAARYAVVARIDALNAQLTDLENSFSAHLASAARAATRLIARVLCVVSLVLWTVGVGLAWRTYRRGIAAEIDLTESEERFRNFAEIASDWFWETGPDLRITYLSERFAEASGVVPETLLGGEEAAARLWGADDPLDPQHRATVAARRPFRGYMHRHERADGSEQYWKLSGLPVYDAAGEFVGYRGTGSDVTTEIQAAQALVEAKEASDQASRAKSEFLANMSHELRTPLNAILGFSEITKDRLFGDAFDKYTDYARDIFNSATLLRALIDDVLDLAKIEAGRMELYEEIFDIALTVATMVRLLGQKADAAQLRLRTEIAPGLPLLNADQRKLKQILLNLLSNAIKFTPPGGTVTIAARRNSAGDLEIAVSDDGIGIATNKIARALEPFGQIENSLTRSHTGTGLGLPLVKALVVLHGGTLALTSTVGRGTTVLIALPRRRLIERPAAALERSEPRLASSPE